MPKAAKCIIAPSSSSRDESTANGRAKGGLKVLLRSFASDLLPEKARYCLQKARQSLRVRLQRAAREPIVNPSLAAEPAQPITAAEHLRVARAALQESLRNKDSFTPNTGVLLPLNEADESRLSKSSRDLRGGTQMRRLIASRTCRTYFSAEEIEASKVASETRRQNRIAEQARRIYHMRHLP